MIASAGNWQPISYGAEINGQRAQVHKVSETDDRGNTVERWACWVQDKYYGDFDLAVAMMTAESVAGIPREPTKADREIQQLIHAEIEMQQPEPDHALVHCPDDRDWCCTGCDWQKSANYSAAMAASVWSADHAKWGEL
jgi:hypothetical protein